MSQYVLQQTEVTALQNPAGVFSGAVLNTGNANLGSSSFGFSKVRAMVFSDVSGTLNIQQSKDKNPATWRTTATIAVVAGPALILESLIVRQFVRVNYVNGGTIQTIFELETCLVAI